MPAYELGGDGKTLVPVKTATALATKIATLAQAPRRSGAVVKGYMGSGTADDPLLIQSVDDLLDLARPDVGQQGYHFLQTVDLDVSRISTWPTIIFNGNYDGQWKKISGGRQSNKDIINWLFARIEKSRIKRLNLEKWGLAKMALNQCELLSCTTSVALVDGIQQSDIFSCEAQDNIVKGAAVGCRFASCVTSKSLAKAVESCEIRSCQSGSALVFGHAEKTKIMDCLVTTFDRESRISGGTSEVLLKSTVECCFVTGIFGHSYPSGFAREVLLSTISRCALGEFGSTEIGYHCAGRIAASGCGNSQFKDNVAIDDVRVYSKGHIDGESIAASRFNQRYFEHTLDWDFEKTWVWDNKNDRPALRQVGVGATPAAMPTATKAPAASEKKPSVDLLTQQVKANMWL